MTPADFSLEYDRLCKKAEELFKEYDPCGIKDGKCSESRTYGTRPFCCTQCEHLIEEHGCGVQALYCKIWVCDHLYETMPEDFCMRQRTIMKEIDAFLGRAAKATNSFPIWVRKAKYQMLRNHFGKRRLS